MSMSSSDSDTESDRRGGHDSDESYTADESEWDAESSDDSMVGTRVRRTTTAKSRRRRRSNTGAAAAVSSNSNSNSNSKGICRNNFWTVWILKEREELL